ncbi:unnamed protein product [Lymnaea stagnalis]|uniref:Uncharacterized protein n=1 Tax=Lymnaea stagnalis TaxID=6523 RepID=A0AAV2I114_LYMST
MADNVEPEPPPPPPEEVAVTQPVTQTATPIPPTAPPPRQGCMDKRSTLEKVLVVLVVIILIILLGFIAAFLVFYFFSTPPEVTCLTDSCVKSAARLRSYIDESVNPCDDFYQYACGGWLKSQVLAPDKSKIDLETLIGDSNAIKIKTLLEQREEDDPVYKTQPRKFYAACLDLNTLNERGAEPFFKLVKEVGKFPALDSSWNETDFDFEDTIIKLHNLKVDPLIRYSVSRDLRSAESNRIYVSSRFPQKLYEQSLVENLVKLGVNRSSAELEVKDIMEFAEKLAKLIPAEEAKIDFESKDNRMTVAMMNAKYTWVNWQKLFQGMIESYGGTGFIRFDEIVINEEPLYLEKLGPLLNATSKRVLANYLMSHLLVFTEALGSDFVAIGDKVIEETQGTKPQQRWEKCVESAIQFFPDAVSRMYIDQYFSKDAREYLKSMIVDLSNAFKELLEENTWMTKDTKKKAEAKLKSMQSKIGYPDYILDDNWLNGLYSFVQNEESKFFETIVASNKYATQENAKMLRVSNKDIWRVHPAIGNAFYDSLGNDIIFPAAFLQPPVYSPEYTSSQLFGATASYMGRLIARGFVDFNGNQYDANGELNKWWGKEDMANFKSRASCFVDQYGCYKWDGNSLDGEKTLDENIADNGGLKQSYRAYRNFIKRRGTEETKLPGLKLNHDQIFFLSFAQVWCAKIRNEAKQIILEKDKHAPGPYRVLGTLQNSKEFADAFRCRSDSRMNPLKKCVVW